MLERPTSSVARLRRRITTWLMTGSAVEDAELPILCRDDRVRGPVLVGRIACVESSALEGLCISVEWVSEGAIVSPVGVVSHDARTLD